MDKEKIEKTNEIKNLVKPCRIISFCPYGPLIAEQFPLLKEPDEMSCAVFGHQCPIYFVAEPVCDGDMSSAEEIEKMYNTLNEVWGEADVVSLEKKEED